MLLLWALPSIGSAADVVLVPADVIDVQRVDDLPVGAMSLAMGWRFRSGHSEAWAGTGL